jgi:site-specific recombinase XerD
MLYNTGARVSEITRVKVGDIVLDEHAACVHLHGNERDHGNRRGCFQGN